MLILFSEKIVSFLIRLLHGFHRLCNLSPFVAAGPGLQCLNTEFVKIAYCGGEIDPCLLPSGYTTLKRLLNVESTFESMLQWRCFYVV